MEEAGPRTATKGPQSGTLPLSSPSEPESHRDTGPPCAPGDGRAGPGAVEAADCSIPGCSVARAGFDGSSLRGPREVGALTLRLSLY